MHVTYDKEKFTSNLLKHGVHFHLVERFEWASALISEPYERNYIGKPELRRNAYGLIDGRLYVLVYPVVPFETGTLHVISLRKANEREKTGYDNARK